MSLLDEIKFPRCCPKCNDRNIAYIFYGMPEYETVADGLDAEKIVLGGCAIRDESAQWCCNNCSHKWGDLLVFEEDL